jgi:hypothetical protein
MERSLDSDIGIDLKKPYLYDSPASVIEDGRRGSHPGLTLTVTYQQDGEKRTKPEHENEQNKSINGNPVPMLMVIS